jgi:hypothetical protein
MHVDQSCPYYLFHHLNKADASHKADYHKQGDAYLAELEKLNKNSKDKFNDIPKSLTNLIACFICDGVPCFSVLISQI